MTGKTQVMVGIKETVRYPSGKTAEEKTHRFTFEIPDKYAETDDMAKTKALQMILNKLGKGHDLFVILTFWDKNKAKQRKVEFEYFSKNPKFKMPDDFTELKNYGKSTKSAGAKFDTAMEKGISGVKKAGAVVGKGLDWFFMEGEYAHLRKKTTPTKKKTTTKKATTTRKKTTTTKRKTTPRKTTTTRSRQYAPSRMYDMDYDDYYPEFFEDYGNIRSLPKRRY